MAMLKITAQRAAAMEMHGEGKFEVRNRSIVFTGNDDRSAIWGPTRSVADAEMQLRSWRRVLTPRPPEGNPFPPSYQQHALWERNHEPKEV